MSNSRYWLRILLIAGMTILVLGLLVGCLAIFGDHPDRRQLHYSLVIGEPVSINDDPDSTFVPPRLTEESRQEIEEAQYEISVFPRLLKQLNTKRETNTK